MNKITKKAALLYRSQGKPGKIEVTPTKPHSTQANLQVVYSTGLAESCPEKTVSLPVVTPQKGTWLQLSRMELPFWVWAILSHWPENR